MCVVTCKYLQYKESASKVPHQSALEAIYWFCPWKKDKNQALTWHLDANNM